MKVEQVFDSPPGDAQLALKLEAENGWVDGSASVRAANARQAVTDNAAQVRYRM